MSNHDLVTSVSSESVPRIKPKTFIRFDNDGVAIVVPCGDFKPLLVNQTITEVLRLIDADELTVAQIVGKLHQKYRQISYAVLEQDIMRVVTFLIGHGVIQLAESDRCSIA